MRKDHTTHDLSGAVCKGACNACGSASLPTCFCAVNLTCLHVLQHMDWEAAKQQAQALDTDGDGLVSHDEILALVKECVPTRDADKDGDISHEEYLDYVKKRVTAGKK